MKGDLQSLAKIVKQTITIFLFFVIFRIFVFLITVFFQTAFYFLDRVQLRKFSAISEDNGRMDISADSGPNLNLFKTPRFFAYVCQEPLNVSLPVNVSTHGVKFIEPKVIFI